MATAAQALQSDPAAKASRPARSGPVVAKPTTNVAGDYWVQIGAFRDPETANRLAASLRQQSYNVSESTATVGKTESSVPPPKPVPPLAAVGDGYDVHVGGVPSPDLRAKLTAKGLSVASSTDGVIVRPSLALRDAVALSKELATEGLKVQVKRSRGSERTGQGIAVPSASAPVPMPAGGETLHRVRIGVFPDRATAAALVAELEAKGFKPFIARGGD